MNRSSAASSLASLAILGCFAAVGVFEFSLVLRQWAEAAMGIAGKQLFAGVMLLSVGGLLTSPTLREGAGSPMDARKVVGMFAMVAGTVLTVSAFAGFIYLLIVS